MYTNVLTKERTSEGFVKRALCYKRMDCLDEALEDIDNAFSSGSATPKMHLHKGTILFGLEKIAEAREQFQAGLSLDPSSSQLATWIRKCDAINPVEPQPAVAPAPIAIVSGAAPATISSLPNRQREGALKRDWYQSPTHVFINIYVKGCDKDSVHVDFTAQNMSLDINLPDNVVLNEDIDLYAAIDPAASTWIVKKTSVEVKMKKLALGQWASLEMNTTMLEATLKREAAERAALKKDSEAREADAARKIAAASTLPSVSAKAEAMEPLPSLARVAPTKNWDKLVNEELEKDKDEGNINTLFQDIFSKGSDETRKAMMKSFTESGGTVLSTNWSEVGSKTVEPTPPTGMEAKKWSG
mgnify:CR=1 FL=1